MTDDLKLPEVLSLAAAADTLGCSTRTLRRAIDAGELRASQLADRGCWAVQRADLLAWLDARAAPRGRPITAVPPAPNTRRRNPRGRGSLRGELDRISEAA